MLSFLIAFNNLLNHAFGAPVTAMLLKLGVHPRNPAAPIDRTFALELIVTAVLLVFFLLVRVTLSIERPGPFQLLAEMIHEFVGGQGEAIIGHGYQPHVTFATAILLFVVTANCFGLLPGIPTPTANPVVPLGIAILTFLYYNFHGLKAQGPVGYLKHFLGPIWWIAPLLFPIEIISHLARVMSLTIRLYANMFASDLLTLVFFSLVPIGIPIVFLGLHFAVALIQAYVFMLLALIYLSQAVAHEDH